MFGDIWKKKKGPVIIIFVSSLANKDHKIYIWDIIAEYLVLRRPSSLFRHDSRRGESRLPLQLSTTKEYWKRLASKKIQELKQKKSSYNIIITSNLLSITIAKAPKTSYLMYLDDLKESVGTIVENASRATVVADRKPAISKHKSVDTRRFVTTILRMRL
ncbi:hypothetical protein BDF21DRAFT_452979 [Thamnidium elegans]|nr:hypothetical protein BDF21DRAFT_452979 [Thamnidium elegans]